MTQPVADMLSWPYLELAAEFFLLVAVMVLIPVAIRVVLSVAFGIEIRFARVRELIQRGGADPFDSEAGRDRL